MQRMKYILNQTVVNKYQDGQTAVKQITDISENLSLAFANQILIPSLSVYLSSKAFRVAEPYISMVEFVLKDDRLRNVLSGMLLIMVSHDKYSHSYISSAVEKACNLDDQIIFHVYLPALMYAVAFEKKLELSTNRRKNEKSWAAIVKRANEKARALQFWSFVKKTSRQALDGELDSVDRPSKFCPVIIGKIIMTYAVNNLLKGHGMLINQVPRGCDKNCSICSNQLQGAEDGMGLAERPVVVCPFSEGTHGFHAECIANSISASAGLEIRCHTCGNMQYLGYSSNSTIIS
jgi:hypothetical protein